MKKKIVHIIPSPGLGGAETVVKEIVFNNKDKIFFLKKDKINRFTKISDRVYFGTNSRFYKFNFFIFLRLYRLVKKEEINFLHSHVANSIFYAILIKMFNDKVEIVYHEHGEISRNKKLSLFLRLFQSKINIFIAVSETIKKELVSRSQIPHQKIKVLYNFVDLKKFNNNFDVNIMQTEKKKINIRPGEFVIGFAGRLVDIKGCEYLLRALPFIEFNYKCIIAGDGYLRNHLEKLTEELRIQDKVIFLGYQENMVNFYSLLNVYVMPSLSEASPMAFYEAQAYGIPIIGSNVPAIDEFIVPYENGLLFEVKNYKDLSDKLNTIYKDSILRAKIYKFSIKNIQQYSLDNYLKALKEIYLNLK